MHPDHDDNSFETNPWYTELGAEKYIQALTDIIGIQNKTLPGTSPDFHPEMSEKEKCEWLMLLARISKSM